MPHGRGVRQPRSPLVPLTSAGELYEPPRQTSPVLSFSGLSHYLLALEKMPPPPGAYPSGTRLTVGTHEVVIDRYISEGGFAHVYTVFVEPPLPNHEVACLKRVAVPNKIYLNLLRAEVEAMQRLSGSPTIVQYIDSHAERMRSGGQGYEVFLLMEYCSGGGLIDFMNTRLRDQLREFEVLKIMYDITLGLANMHYLQPPLIHRDLKIENVLVSGNGTYKLCDFGSASPPLRVPNTPQEAQILEDDIQHHTTLQYRSPEMVDISRGLPIDEKSDIWALGVFLYKLCYYTTPFERQGQTLEQLNAAITTATYVIPPRPAYSERLRNMIRVLLQINPASRPNVYQVMEEVCDMRNIECPIVDIYNPKNAALRGIPPMGPHMPTTQPLQMPPRPSRPTHQPPVLSVGASSAHSAGQGLVPVRSPSHSAVPGPSIPGPVQMSLPGGSIPTQGPAPHVLSQSSVHGAVHGPVQGSMQLSIYDPVQAPTSGTLGLSTEPSSPLSRATSPIASDEDVEARFPPVDLLQIEQPAQQPSQQPVQQSAQQSAPQHAIPLIDLGPLGGAPVQSAPKNAPAIPPKTPKSSSSLGAGDYPMPVRPKSKPKPIPSQIQPQAQVPQLQVYPNAADEDLEASGLSQSAQSHNGPLTNNKLSRILTGLNERSPTVIMEPEKQPQDLSSVDFLRTLDHHHEDGPSGRPLSRPPSRATNLSRSASLGYHHGHGHGHAHKISTLFGRRPSIPTPGSGMGPNYDDDDDEDSFVFTPTAAPTSTSVPTTNRDKQKGQSSWQLPSTSHESDGDSTSSGTVSSEDEGGAMNGATEEGYYEFRPTNTIQQRVHAFLSNQTLEEPPLRTARGYGKYVDQQVQTQQGQYLGSKSTPALVRPKSMYAGGASRPAVPPRSQKPSLQRSHSDESLGTPKPVNVGRDAPGKPAKPAKPARKPTLTKPQKSVSSSLY